jgi:hypothetical protein
MFFGENEGELTMKKFLRRSYSAQYLFQLTLAFNFLLGATSSWAQVIIVTNINDSGPGSLRDAINTANTNEVAQTITFNPAVFPPRNRCAAPPLDQSNLAAETAGTAIASEFAAQVITAGRAGILASVDFAIRKFDGFTFGDITVQVRGVTSGVPNSTILGSKTFPNSLIAPIAAEFTTFDLRSLNLFLNAGDVFSVVVVSTNQSGSLFPIALTDNLYARGDLFASTDGTNWFSFGRDTRFRTFVVNTKEANKPAPGTITLASALPNITGPGDSINGSGACVVLDGKNLPVDAGLRVRASNVTIQGLTIQNFIGNDAVRVEARDATPLVTGVIITDNLFHNNFRGARIDGGNQNNNTEVSASVIGNTLTENLRGIAVLGNAEGSDGGNTVSAFIDSNTIRGTQIPPLVGGDGIAVIGAAGIGSGNSIIATLSSNTLDDIPDDGIVVIGCGGGATGSFNRLEATITGNVIRYKNNNSPPNFVNTGITISGAGGESGDLSFCMDNTIVFEVSNNDVDGFKNSNISVSGGDEGTQRNDVEGTIVGNTFKNSRGNPGGSNLGGTGISVSAGSGTQHFVHDIAITGNTVRGNPRRGINISGGSSTDSDVTRITVSSNTVNGKPPESIVPEPDQDGIFVTGSTNALNAVLSEILIDGNITKNNRQDGIRITRGDATNEVLLSGITNNIATDNSRDGILITSNVPGLGAIPVSGNRCNDNGQDGIDINSSGYGVSNNSCSKNVVDGINAVVGNTNDGGNSGRRNGACNQPSFCFNTPLP